MPWTIIGTAAIGILLRLVLPFFFALFTVSITRDTSSSGQKKRTEMGKYSEAIESNAKMSVFMPIIKWFDIRFLSSFSLTQCLFLFLFPFQAISPLPFAFEQIEIFSVVVICAHGTEKKFQEIDPEWHIFLHWGGRKICAANQKWASATHIKTKNRD